MSVGPIRTVVAVDRHGKRPVFILDCGHALHEDELARPDNWRTLRAGRPVSYCEACEEDCDETLKNHDTPRGTM